MCRKGDFCDGKQSVAYTTTLRSVTLARLEESLTTVQALAALPAAVRPRSEYDQVGVCSACLSEYLRRDHARSGREGARSGKRPGDRSDLQIALGLDDFEAPQISNSRRGFQQSAVGSRFMQPTAASRVREAATGGASCLETKLR